MWSSWPSFSSLFAGLLGLRPAWSGAAWSGAGRQELWWNSSTFPTKWTFLRLPAYCPAFPLSLCVPAHCPGPGILLLEILLGILLRIPGLLQLMWSSWPSFSSLFAGLLGLRPAWSGAAWSGAGRQELWWTSSTFSSKWALLLLPHLHGGPSCHQ
jgi:hypothetical protein